MNPIKTGKFISKLRREQNMTQEQLGELLGVTNKTISRWENGNYMPGIEMLRLMGRTFGVGVEELIDGAHCTEGALCKEIQQDMLPEPKESAFCLEEKKKFWIGKWRREHIFLLVILGAIVFLAVIVPILTKKTAYLGLVPLIAFLEYGWQNNRMMSYVEKQLYGGK